MKLTDVLTKKILFVLLFALLTFIGYQINFSAIIGAEAQYFTFFQFFGPMAGAFLGPVVGVISVFAAEIGNYLLLGKAFDMIGMLRLLPMLFAAVYFASNKDKLSKLSAIVPLVCMGLFWAHPIGQQAWYYALYWLIPIAGKFMSKRLFLKSLGSTFTAHAVGSTLFLYTVPMPAEAWIALIPVVAVERILFALGISVSFVGLNTVLSRFEAFIPADALKVHKEYVLSKKNLPVLS
jgi:hypothetical protein